VRSALAAVAVVLVVAPAAGAATVRVGSTGAVDYAAAPGETNTLAASASGTTVTLTDDGATIVPGAGCTAAGAHRATCTAESFPRLSADLGDGDDRATVTGLLAAVLDGGSGNDALAGGDARDVLDGGPGDDDLRGGAEDDTLSGDGPGLATDDGADRLDGGPGADVLDCGPGPDADVDGDGADRADGCEQDVSSTPPATPPPTTTPPPPAAEPAPPESQARASDPLDPGVIVPLQQVSPETARSVVTVPVALTLRVPSAIARATLRRAGLRVTLACSIQCRATLRLARGTRALVRNTVTAGRTARAVRLRARTGAGTIVLRVTAPGVTTRTQRVRVH
jgi:Ca2+-binding RTX toxin-like protein